MTPAGCGGGGGVLCMVQLAAVQSSGQQWAHMRVSVHCMCWSDMWPCVGVVYCGVSGLTMSVMWCDVIMSPSLHVQLHVTT